MRGGIAFKLTPSGSGYRETTLFAFGDREGYSPWAGPAIDSAGNLHGTTVSGGGPGSDGALYKLTPGSPQYTVTVLNDAEEPSASGTPIVTSYGTVYSIVSGYDDGGGTVLEFTPGPSVYTMSTLYTFSGGTAGYLPRGDLVIDPSGAIYGAASGGTRQERFPLEQHGGFATRPPASSRAVWMQREAPRRVSHRTAARKALRGECQAYVTGIRQT